MRKFCSNLPNHKIIIGATSRINGIHRSSDGQHWRPPSFFQSFLIQEVPLPIIDLRWKCQWFQALNPWNFQAKSLNSCCSSTPFTGRHWLILATRRSMAVQYLPIFEENEWRRRIESLVCIYLFNDFAHYFFRVILLYPIFTQCYMNIF